jgi:hypothetical protein
MIFVVLTMMLSTGCSIALEGPDGLTHKVYPLEGTILVRVYNRCSPLLRVESTQHAVDIPYGESRQVLLPTTIGQNKYDPKDVVMDAYTADRKELGTKRIQLNSNYNSAVTTRSLIVGGKDADIMISGACGY